MKKMKRACIPFNDASFVGMDILKNLKKIKTLKILIKRPNIELDDLFGIEKYYIENKKSLTVSIIMSTSLERRRYEEIFKPYFMNLNPKLKILDLNGGIMPDIWIFEYHAFKDYINVKKRLFQKKIYPHLLVPHKKYILLIERPPLRLHYSKCSKDDQVKEMNDDPRMSNITKHFLKINCKCKKCLFMNVKNVII